LFDRELKKSTIKMYLCKYDFIAKRYGKVSYESLVETILELRKQEKSENYINKFVLFGRLIGKFKGDQRFESIKKIKVNRKLLRKDTLSIDEIKGVLSFLETDREKKMSFAYIVLASTGMRPSEFLKLFVTDISNNTFILRDTKTHQNRLVPVPDIIKKPMEDYLKSHKHDLLFCKDDGTPYVTETLSREFRRRLRLLGIKGKKTLYSLRHSLITRLIEEDVNLFRIQKLVGHSNVQTTANYCHLSTKDVESALQKDSFSRKNIEPRRLLSSLVEKIKEFGLQDDERFGFELTENGKEVFFKVSIQ
jgi:integrase/recombinase XerD